MRAHLLWGLAVILATIVAAGSITSLAGRNVGEAGLGGVYQIEMNVDTDPSGHDEFIFGNNSHNMLVQVLINGSNVTISGPAPWITVTGTISGGSMIMATGNGTVAGFPNITETFIGQIDAETLTGQYAFGTDGDLPPGGGTGQPAVYEVKPKPTGATPTSTRTRTPTATPPEQLFSIIVLKLNNDNLNPLSAWEFNLYAGPDCTGIPIDSGVTDDDGLLDFLNLQAGPYSVQEKQQDGWNVVGLECENVTAGFAGTPSGAPPCPVQPDADFPQPGCDTFLSGARVNVQINATGDVFPVNLSGATQIVRENKPTDKDADGLEEVNTEMVFMHLVGGNIEVNEASGSISDGLIEEQQNVTPGVLDFPANSYFNVYFEVELNGVTLHNVVPFHVECKIEEIPPYMCLYQPPITSPIELMNDQNMKIAKLIHGLHLPIPPKEVLIIFANEQKPATPTATPPGKDIGDVNDDGSVDSIDSLLIQQYVAQLIDTLPNAASADTDDDGDIDAIDSQLILQFGAGLIDELPPP